MLPSNGLNSNNMRQIGKAMSAQAITTATCQILLFAPVQKRLGTIGTFRVAAVFYPLAFALFPLTSYLARVEQDAGVEVYTKTWISLSVQLFCLALANIVSERSYNSFIG
jgi:hypothetical protein